MCFQIEAMLSAMCDGTPCVQYHHKDSGVYEVWVPAPFEPDPIGKATARLLASFEARQKRVIRTVRKTPEVSVCHWEQTHSNPLDSLKDFIEETSDDRY